MTRSLLVGAVGKHMEVIFFTFSSLDWYGTGSTHTSSSVSPGNSKTRTEASTGADPVGRWIAIHLLPQNRLHNPLWPIGTQIPSELWKTCTCAVHSMNGQKTLADPRRRSWPQWERLQISRFPSMSGLGMRCQFHTSILCWPRHCPSKWALPTDLMLYKLCHGGEHSCLHAGFHVVSSWRRSLASVSLPCPQPTSWCLVINTTSSQSRDSVTLDSTPTARYIIYRTWEMSLLPP